MAEETVTTERPADAAPGNTTIIRETRSTGSGTGIIMALVLLVAIVGGIYLFSQNSETAKDNAIAEAAGDIGNAASKVGDAAQDAVNTEK
ncbi:MULTISPECIES: hypothetical protein [Novosphingobium]|jgi:hypothetical protein|uniref:Uncharacterized protein n=1 Tax=Novosphingobium panipatense TaxID=428991 RepID=A0ABY1PZ21_9SPHN|nr:MULTISPECIES: hypothetical protein [Novosphingobium]SMP53535.1 hypothetical protein SAMN06296065_101431 [Novosphingobium panipatense]